MPEIEVQEEPGQNAVFEPQGKGSLGISTLIGVEILSLLLASTLGSALFLGGNLREQLRPALAHSNGTWIITTVSLPAATLAVLLLPAAALFAASSLRAESRFRFWLAVSASFLAWFWVVGDSVLYSRFGRHLDDIIRYALLPEGHVAAGDTGGNLRFALHLLTWSVCGAALHLGTRWGSKKLFARSSLMFGRFILAVASILTCAQIASLWVLGPILPDGFGPRLYASLAMRPVGITSFSKHQPRDPALRELQQRLQAEYARLFPFIFQKHPEITPPIIPPEKRLNVAIIVAESLRHDQLNPQTMPRLFEWSKKGLRATRHYSASNHSEAGLFVLLYGESALRYNTTLDHKVEPTLCRLLRASGYRCGYYTGHPKVWLRREEFLNKRTMDDFVHDDQGSWNDWDRKALESSARHLAEKTPRLSLTFLMSSHYEYRYPPVYAKHLPDDLPAVSFLSGQIQRKEYEQCRNRYQNVCNYLDDLVADHIEQLSPNTLVVFTGDHGESTGEDGRFGHGYGFSDLLTRVPFIMVGPGIEPEVRTALSSHLDVLPTVVRALGVTSDAPGTPLQVPAQEHPLFLTYTTRGRPYADALLIMEHARLKLRIDPFRPEVEVHGFEDALGYAVQGQLSESDVARLSRSFTEQMVSNGKGVLLQR